MRPLSAFHLIATRTTAVKGWSAALLTFMLLLIVAVDATSNHVYTSFGGDVTLSCSNDAASMTSSDDNVIVDWFDYVHNNVTDPINVRDRIKASSDYRAKIQITTQNTLKIRQLNETDAGSYICVVRSSNISKSFIVTVYSVPQCFGVTSLSEGDTPELKCNSTFFGVLAASRMQWLHRDVTSGSDEVAVESLDLFDTRLAERSVRVAPVTHLDDGSSYTCRMTLNDVTECRLVLSVVYGARDLELDPIKEIYETGDEIRCSASGNPRPKVILRLASDSNTGTSGTGSASLIVPDSWRNQPHPIELECSASNAVHGIDHVATKSVNFSVVDAEPKKGEDTIAKASAFSISIPIIGGIVIGVVILVAILLAVVCMRICKDRKAAEALKTPPPPAASGSHKPDFFKNENAKKVENHH